MHRSFEVTVPEGATDALLDELRELDDVVSLAVRRGASVKPPGDLISLHVLNRGGDRVLELVGAAAEHGEISVATSQVDALIDPAHAEQVVDDVDEALWEEAETGLRHHAVLSANFLGTMACGGVVAACGLAMTTSTQATALVAAAVIAPGFEPLAKIPLGIVLGRPSLAWRGLRSALVGYLVLVLAAAATVPIIASAGYDLPEIYTRNEIGHEIVDPSTVGLLVSAAAALAGSIMIVAHRWALLVGPLIALQLIHAAALVGVMAALAEWGQALEALARVGIDLVFVLVAGLLVFGLKQAFVHRRRPLV